MPRQRISLVVAAGLIACALLHRGEAVWPWLLTVSLVTSALGIGLALATTADRPGLGKPARLVASVLVVLGWYFRIHAGPAFDVLPPAPFLARSFDLPPALGLSFGAAGLYLLSESKALLNGRRLVGIGAILLLSTVLLPQTQGGDLTSPIIATLQYSALVAVLGLLLVGAAGGLAWVTIRSPVLPQARLRTAAAALLVAVPVWLAGTGAFTTALSTLGDLLAIAACLVLFLREAPENPAVDARTAWTAEAIAVAGLSGTWWLLKIHGLGYSATDEYIYFYAARAWGDGVWPYRDFFFSHPPLHLVIPMILFKLFGFHHLMAKLVSPVAIFIAGLALWRSARRHFGPVAGVATFAMFLFAAEVLKSSTTFTGVDLTTLFLALGVVAALDRKAFQAGLWFGVSVCTGVYGLAGFVTFFVLALAAPRREGKGRSPLLQYDAVRMLAGFALIAGLVNVAFLAFAGDRYVDGVYRYHLLKVMKSTEQHSLSDDPFALLYNAVLLLGGHDLRASLYYHAAHYWFALLALVAVASHRASAGRPPVSRRPRSWWPTVPGRSNPDGAVILLFLSAAGTLTEIGSLRERYDFYFTILFPTLSLLGGFVIGELVRLADTAVAPQEPFQRRKPISATPAWRWPAAALVLAALWVPIDAWANHTAFPEEIAARGESKGAGEQLRFEWVPSPVLPALGEVAHALFWSDQRVRGEIQSGIRHFLWSKKRFFETAPELARYVESHTTPEDTITGSSDYAPLVALLANRRLSGNQVDTNTKIFVTGIVSEKQYWTQVCRDQPAYILAAELSFFNPSELSKLPVAGQYFQRETTFTDHGLKQWRPVQIDLWRRRHEPPGEICAAGR